VVQLERVVANSPLKQGPQYPEDKKAHPDGAIHHQSGKAVAAKFPGNEGKSGDSHQPGDDQKKDVSHDLYRKVVFEWREQNTLRQIPRKNTLSPSFIL